MKTWKNTLLTVNEQKGIQKAADILIKSYPIKDIILFGSKARGESDSFSDIDLLIVFNEQQTWKDEKAIVELLFDIGIEYDIIFSPLFIHKNEWEEGLFKEYPIYNEILTDGALLFSEAPASYQ